MTKRLYFKLGNWYYVYLYCITRTYLVHVVGLLKLRYYLKYSTRYYWQARSQHIYIYLGLVLYRTYTQEFESLLVTIERTGKINEFRTNVFVQRSSTVQIPTYVRSAKMRRVKKGQLQTTSRTSSSSSTTSIKMVKLGRSVSKPIVKRGAWKAYADRKRHVAREAKLLRLFAWFIEKRVRTERLSRAFERMKCAVVLEKNADMWCRTEEMKRRVDILRSERNREAKKRAEETKRATAFEWDIARLQKKHLEQKKTLEEKTDKVTTMEHAFREKWTVAEKENTKLRDAKKRSLTKVERMEALVGELKRKNAILERAVKTKDAHVLMLIKSQAKLRRDLCDARRCVSDADALTGLRTKRQNGGSQPSVSSRIRSFR